MKKLQTFLLCGVLLFFGIVINHKYAPTLQADTPVMLPSANQFELPLNVNILANGKIHIANALNRAVNVQVERKAQTKVVKKYIVKFRYITIYKNQRGTVNRLITRRNDSVINNRIRDSISLLIPSQSSGKDSILTCK
jgi:hypothetical protein